MAVGRKAAGKAGQSDAPIELESDDDDDDDSEAGGVEVVERGSDASAGGRLPAEDKDSNGVGGFGGGMVNLWFMNLRGLPKCQDSA